MEELSPVARRGHNWLPYSPDLKPLDRFVWGCIKDQVWRIQPELIQELQQAKDHFNRDAAQRSSE